MPPFNTSQKIFGRFLAGDYFDGLIRLQVKYKRQEWGLKTMEFQTGHRLI